MKNHKLLSAVFICLSLLPLLQAAAADRPNILWLTVEDIGAQLGCYGDAYADTPNLDVLAARGTLYLHAWSNAPVCAPARTTIITGVYPPSTGSEHMRSMTRMPEGMQMYPQLLRQAGYYCTNNSKKDYNLQEPDGVWDESSKKAHWKNRQADQPFFAIFNNTVTHESKIRTRPHDWVHDPAQARLPAYHPDTIEVRQDWAQYYDNITTMDGWVAQKLQELTDAGLADDTIVFFYGDHGSGMPRGKRCAYDSGERVPMIVYIPEKFRDLATEDYGVGAKSERLVSFVDLAPTLCSLIGIQPPDVMQGYAFLGEYATAPQPFIYGFRGRMDERYDMVRSVRDQRYIYVRNFMPQFGAGQHVAYMFITPSTRVWWELYEQGKLTPEQAAFWEPRPAEELYDLQSDPDEVHNLADSPEHRKILQRMRQAQRALALRIRDVGYLPENEIHERAGDGAPYTMGHDPSRYPLKRIMAAAEAASSRKTEDLPVLLRAFRDEDSAVRYWASMGGVIRGPKTFAAVHKSLSTALTDEAPSVRIASAWALAKHGNETDLAGALPVLLDLADYSQHGLYVALMALTAIDDLDQRAVGIVDQLKQLPNEVDRKERRFGYGLKPLMAKTLADLQE